MYLQLSGDSQLYQKMGETLQIGTWNTKSQAAGELHVQLSYFIYSIYCKLLISPSWLLADFCPLVQTGSSL